MKQFLFVATAVLLTACSGMQLGKGKQRVLLKDYAEGRVVDIAITDRLTGAQEMLFVSMPKRSAFLEGYIQGQVTDYEDNPVEGVVVRAIAEGEQKVVDANKSQLQSSAFDAGVTDTQGVYRLRFSLPILNRMVDVRGKFLYNPGWEQEKVNLGKAYEPQIKESPFRLLFDEREGMIVFAEGIRKLIVKSVSSGAGPKQPLPKGGKQPAGTGPAEGEKAAPAKGGEEDLFKSFGL
ncbi:MAG: carboxypeptidase regulatory-like domain-containing protein [Elusimicrobia bacterium]|nr:carboxypeptidase regulatory-like domain-containing protein [Elusimicrobiota bacterium]